MASTINYPQVNWVPTFQGDKYEQWAMQMRSIFIFQDLWELVQEGYEQPPKDDTKDSSWDETKIKQYKQNRIRDNYACLYYIVESMKQYLQRSCPLKQRWRLGGSWRQNTEAPKRKTNKNMSCISFDSGQEEEVKDESQVKPRS